MIEFAVRHEGVPEGMGRWVLAVDSAENMFLLASDDGEFYWRLIADCRLVRALTPDNPRLVIPVQGQPKAGIVVPGVQNGQRA